MLTLEDTIRRRGEVVAQDTPDGAVLVDMTSGRCWELNVVGAFLWSLLETPAALSDLCGSLRARYETAASEAIERDVMALVTTLLSAGLVEADRRAPAAILK